MSNQIEAGVNFAPTNDMQLKSLLPRDGAGRVIWSTFGDDQARINSAIEHEARIMLAQESLDNFPARKRFPDHWKFLYRVLTERYPGGMATLKMNLGLDTAKPIGYWTPELIEQEAAQILNTHGKLTQKFLERELHKSDLRTAISRVYPGGFIGLKEKLGTKTQKPDGYWTQDTIEKEFAEIMNGGQIDTTSLKKRRSDVASAISIHYPGGMRALRQKFGLEPGYREPGYWTDPQKIEFEARKVLAENNGSLSHEASKKSGTSALSYAISKYYPGGMLALREKLGDPLDRKPNGYWRNPQNIEAEAAKLIEQGIELSHRGLKKAGKNGLIGAIYMYYPGKMQALREKTDAVHREETLRVQRIEEEARRLSDEGVDITAKSLIKAGRADLTRLIYSYYPGKITQLRETLGLGATRHPPDYWADPAKIEEEVGKFLTKGNTLTQKSLMEAGLSSLTHAINRYYPGGLLAIKAKFGIDYRKPQGYWEELPHIEGEVAKLLDSGFTFSQRSLINANMYSLVSAIQRNYPGGFAGLRERFGIPPLSTENNKVAPDQANEQLERLLEVQNE